MCSFKAFIALCIISLCVFGKSSSSSVCRPFPAKGLDKLCGYNGTVMYEHLYHFDSAMKAVNYVTRLMASCSPYANLIVCSVYIPRCESHIDGPYLPCRRVCDEFNDKCGDKLRKHGMEWIVGMCKLLPAKDDPKTSLGYLGRCFEPPNFKTNFTIESKPKPLKCYPLIVPVCQNIGYKYTVLSTEKQKRSMSYANKTINAPPKDNTTAACPLERKRFFCTENFPACIDNTVAFYCRQKCEEFFYKNCSSPFFYQKEMCMEFPMESSPVDICKQTHWPRAQNWPVVKRKSTGQTTTSTHNPKDIHTTSGEIEPPTDIHTTSGEIEQPTGIYNRPSNTKPPPAGNPNAKARKDIKKSKSHTTRIVGGVLAAGFFIALAVLIAFVIYRKKKKETFPYDKQILYNDETVDF